MSLDQALSTRAQAVLKVLVEHYISEGQPIASKVVASDERVSLSPATVRHMMAELESLGYLQSPHTSAGRIPTAQGYRLFVNHLLTSQPFNDCDTKDLEVLLGAETAIGAQQLIKSASSVLAELTRFVGVATMPKRQQEKLRHVEFLGLSDQRILVILVLNQQEVQNRIIRTSRQFSIDELHKIANYLNAHYMGLELSDIRERILRAMCRDKESLNCLMQEALIVAGEAFARGQEEQSTDCVISGQDKVLDLAAEESVIKAKALFQAFTEKQEVLQLLDHAARAEEVKIFIGDESGYQTFCDCSVITSPYSLHGEVLGALGVVGPLRMPYTQVISLVDVTAKLITEALNQL